MTIIVIGLLFRADAMTFNDIVRICIYLATFEAAKPVWGSVLVSCYMPLPRRQAWALIYSRTLLLQPRRYQAQTARTKDRAIQDPGSCIWPFDRAIFNRSTVRGHFVQVHTDNFKMLVSEENLVFTAFFR